MAEREFFKAILENYEGVCYLSFLESLRTQEHNALIESVRSGFAVILESGKGEGSSFAILMDYLAMVNKVIDRFQKDGPGETQKMSEILEHGRGKLVVVPIPKMKWLVKDYVYTPEGTSSDEDKLNAKKVLLSSTVAYAISKANQSITIKDEHRKEVIYDTIVASLSYIWDNMDSFKYTGPSFLAWAKNWILNAKSEARTQTTHQPKTKTWRPGIPFKKGELVNNSATTWKAQVDLRAEDNKLAPSENPELKIEDEDGIDLISIWKKEGIGMRDVVQGPDVDGIENSHRDGDAIEEQDQIIAKMQDFQESVYDALKDPVSKGLAVAWFNARKEGKQSFDYPDIYRAWESVGIKVEETDVKAHSGKLTTPDGKVMNFNRQNINNWKHKIDEVVSKEANLLGLGQVDPESFKKAKSALS